MSSEHGHRLLQIEVQIAESLERRKYVFLGIAITELILGVVLLGLCVVFSLTLDAYAVFAVIYISECIMYILTASFGIALGCKPYKWLAVVTLVLSIISSISLVIGIAFGIAWLIVGSTTVGAIFVVFCGTSSVLCIVGASFAGSSLKCCVCSRSTQVQDIPIAMPTVNEAFQGAYN
uniref:uncharacterized protein LOC120333474 n=1 Tax=Styela clava TaxID=7725 RepID=UPI001939B160|nr:uncharacterized protein LOC120333474 [Styela clava]